MLVNVGNELPELGAVHRKQWEQGGGKVEVELGGRREWVGRRVRGGPHTRYSVERGDCYPVGVRGSPPGGSPRQPARSLTAASASRTTLAASPWASASLAARRQAPAATDAASITLRMSGRVRASASACLASEIRASVERPPASRSTEPFTCSTGCWGRCPRRCGCGRAISQMRGTRVRRAIPPPRGNFLGRPSYVPCRSSRSFWISPNHAPASREHGGEPTGSGADSRANAHRMVVDFGPQAVHLGAGGGGWRLRRRLG